MILSTRSIAIKLATIAGATLLAGAAVAQTITSNQTGSHNGFFYSYYRSGGSGSMVLGSGSNYGLSWSNVGDIVCGTGWNPGSWRTVNYNCGAYSNSGGGGQGVYGWTTSPLVEYYVADNGSQGGGGGGQYMGQVNSDGGTYNVFHHLQQNQPSIIGTATFWQNIDIRTSGRGTGQNVAITLPNHFNFWNGHGMNLGNFNYQILYLESWGGSGYCNQTCW